MKHIEVVQAIVYRRINDDIEFLVIKRVPKDGSFWQAVTGSIEDGEKPLETLRRELIEEAGLRKLVHISDLLHTYEWASETISGRDSVFAVQVPADASIVLAPNEHDDFKWLPIEQAVELLKYDGNKLSMREAAEYAKELT